MLITLPNQKILSSTTNQKFCISYNNYKLHKHNLTQHTHVHNFTTKQRKSNVPTNSKILPTTLLPFFEFSNNFNIIQVNTIMLSVNHLLSSSRNKKSIPINIIIHSAKLGKFNLGNSHQNTTPHMLHLHSNT